ncbi:hypothetical protein HELRODRAFT_160242 [Helobdella robusta]|uniref:EGF-like domain-containing protein n=1 Tax=Helobdella robusta TaxID=6412 RepID=T1EQ07_HELRO|nr:hypothetical protein HELRODRAFT_160242 [Helobdella robusta]ESO06106.1 hypothetical protein HELRODRAFT_160242 [Helobdella robusta]
MIYISEGLKNEEPLVDNEGSSIEESIIRSKGTEPTSFAMMINMGDVVGRGGKLNGISFVGCMGLLSAILSGDPQLQVPKQKIELQLHSSAGVTDGCVDGCQTMRKLCYNGGVCVNMYTHLHCDCGLTHYVGEFCQHLESGFDNDFELSSLSKNHEAVTLKGDRFLLVNVEGFEHQLYNLQQSMLSFFFKGCELSASTNLRQKKTREYFCTFNTCASGSPTSDYNAELLGYVSKKDGSRLRLSLFNASIHLSLIYDNKKFYNELILTAASNLNDNRWHRVTMTTSMSGELINISVDGHVERMPLGAGEEGEDEVEEEDDDDGGENDDGGDVESEGDDGGGGDDDDVDYKKMRHHVLQWPKFIYFGNTESGSRSASSVSLKTIYINGLSVLNSNQKKFCSFQPTSQASSTTTSSSELRSRQFQTGTSSTFKPSQSLLGDAKLKKSILTNIFLDDVDNINLRNSSKSSRMMKLVTSRVNHTASQTNSPTKAQLGEQTFHENVSSTNGANETPLRSKIRTPSEQTHLNQNLMSDDPSWIGDINSMNGEPDDDHYKHYVAEDFGESIEIKCHKPNNTADNNNNNSHNNNNNNTDHETKNSSKERKENVFQKESNEDEYGAVVEMLMADSELVCRQHKCAPGGRDDGEHVNISG